MKNIPTKCGNGRSPRRKKHIAYGENRTITYCGCDTEVVNRVSKKAERQKAKREVRLSLVQESWWCENCKVEVYSVRCKHCGKSEEEEE